MTKKTEALILLLASYQASAEAMMDTLGFAGHWQDALAKARYGLNRAAEDYEEGETENPAE